MSIEAYRWAKGWPFTQASQKFVLIALADYYNDAERRAWPSMETLCAFTCLSRATVARAVEALKAAGFVEVERWVDSDTNNNLTNRYYLPMFDPKSTTDGTIVYANVYEDDEGKRVAEKVDWPSTSPLTVGTVVPWPG